MVSMVVREGGGGRGESRGGGITSGETTHDPYSTPATVNPLLAQYLKKIGRSVGCLGKKRKGRGGTYEVQSL